MLVHETWWSKTKEKERIWSVKMVGGQGLIGLQPTVTRLSSTTLSSKTNHESLLNICSPKVRTRDPKLMMSAWKLWVVFFHLLRPSVARQVSSWLISNLWLEPAWRRCKKRPFINPRLVTEGLNLISNLHESFIIALVYCLLHFASFRVTCVHDSCTEPVCLGQLKSNYKNIRF